MKKSGSSNSVKTLEQLEQADPPAPTGGLKRSNMSMADMTDGFIKSTESTFGKADASRENVRCARRVVVKVGTAVVTRHTDNRLALGRLGALVEQLHALVRSGRQVILVTSGACCVGRQVLRQQHILNSSPLQMMGNHNFCVAPKHQASASIDAALDPETAPPAASFLEALPGARNIAPRAAAAAGQTGLMALYDSLFTMMDMQAAQLLVTASDFEHDGFREALTATAEDLLSMNVIPVFNENDAILSAMPLLKVEGNENGDRKRFRDNDGLAALLAVQLNADLLMLCTDVDGLYTGNPADPASEYIPTYCPEVHEELISFASKSTNGRGGMMAKVEAAWMAAEQGCSVVILNGKKNDSILQVIAGQMSGTLFNTESARMIALEAQATAHGQSSQEKELAVKKNSAKDAALRARTASRALQGLDTSLLRPLLAMENETVRLRGRAEAGGDPAAGCGQPAGSGGRDPGRQRGGRGRLRIKDRQHPHAAPQAQARQAAGTGCRHPGHRCPGGAHRAADQQDGDRGRALAREGVQPDRRGAHHLRGAAGCSAPDRLPRHPLRQWPSAQGRQGGDQEQRDPAPPHRRGHRGCRPRGGARPHQPGDQPRGRVGPAVPQRRHRPRHPPRLQLPGVAHPEQHQDPGAGACGRHLPRVRGPGRQPGHGHQRGAGQQNRLPRRLQRGGEGAGALRPHRGRPPAQAAGRPARCRHHDVRGAAGGEGAGAARRAIAQARVRHHRPHAGAGRQHGGGHRPHPQERLLAHRIHRLQQRGGGGGVPAQGGQRLRGLEHLHPLLRRLPLRPGRRGGHQHVAHPRAGTRWRGGAHDHPLPHARQRPPGQQGQGHRVHAQASAIGRFLKQQRRPLSSNLACRAAWRWNGSSA